MRITKIVCLAVIVVAVHSSAVGCHQEQQQACKEFFALSLEQQEKLFPTFSLDRQLEIYRCGMEKKPPTIALAYVIARRGEKIIPELTSALQNEKDEWMQNAIIDIFRVMSNKGYLRGRMDLVKQIRDTVDRMKTSRIKEEAEESLKEIERNATTSNK